MEWTSLMSVLLDCCKSKPALLVFWENNLCLKAGVTTTYESENGLDMDDADYLEYYAAAILILEIMSLPESEDFDYEVGELMEISILNEPIKIELEDGTVIWEKELE